MDSAFQLSAVSEQDALNVFLASVHQEFEVIGEQIMTLSTDIANLEKAKLLT